MTAAIHPRPVAVALTGWLALAVAMGIGRFAFTPILPMMQVDAGLSLTAGGWLASANYLGYLLGALSAMAVRVQPAIAIRAGLVTIGVTTLGMGVAHDVVAWVVLRLLAGVASAWVLIYVSAWSLERLTPLRRPVLTSTVYAGVGTGIAIAGAVCLVLMHASASSAQAWIGLGVLSLGATAWIAWMIRSRGGRAASAATTARGHRWDAESVRLVFCYGSFGFGYIIPATFLPVMARAVIDDPAIFGWSWPVFGVAAASSTFAAAALARVMPNRRLWMVSQLTMAAGVAVPVLWPGIAGIMLAALFVGGTFVVCTMVGLQEARLVAGPQATGLMAAMTAAFALGQILGPLSVSYAIKAGASMSAALLLACALLLVSGVALSGIGRPSPTDRTLGPGGRSMKRNVIAIVVLVGLLVSVIAPSAAGAHGRGGPGFVIGGVAAGVFAALTFPLWAFSATVPYAAPPVYTPPPVYAPPAVYAPAAPVVYRPAPAYAGPPPPPQVRREVVYPDGRYLLYGDGVRQPWQWVWIATPSAPPPPPPPR